MCLVMKQDTGCWCCCLNGLMVYWLLSSWCCYEIQLVSWCYYKIQLVSWYYCKIQLVSWYYYKIQLVSWCYYKIQLVSWCGYEIQLVSWCYYGIQLVSWCYYKIQLVSWCGYEIQLVSWCYYGIQLVSWCYYETQLVSWCFYGIQLVFLWNSWLQNEANIILVDMTQHMIHSTFPTYLAFHTTHITVFITIILLTRNTVEPYPVTHFRHSLYGGILIMPWWAEPRRHTVVGLCMYVSVCPSVCLSAGFLAARWKLSAETSSTSKSRYLLGNEL